MSGGHFGYKQHYINEIADEVECLVANCFSKETIEKFKEAAITLRRAGVMAQRIDWLVSGDDGEETFHERWNEELNNIK